MPGPGDWFEDKYGRGETEIVVIEPFAWPEDAGEFDGARFLAAPTDPNITQIIGEWDSWEFGWN